MALLIIGCNKSDDGNDSDQPKNEASDYSILIDSGDMLSGKLLTANASEFEINTGVSVFKTVTKPQLTFESAGVLSMYSKNTDCSGNVVVYDFNENTSENYTVFNDMPSCSRRASAILHTDSAIYIAYVDDISEEESNYFVRIVDISTTAPSFVDVEVEQQPFDLAFANNRLFVLTFNEKSSDDFKILAIKADTFDIILSMNLDIGAKRIFSNPDGNIVIAYPNLHGTLNSSTMAVAYTKYGEGTEPNFFQSRFRRFDAAGKMYYDVPSGSHSTYPTVAAIYDFDTNGSVLYAYENFLTETQRNFEYEIKSTTAVAYDEKNNLLLVGYSKSGAGNKGGMLRIKLSAKPELIDNLDLEGAPYAFFIK